MLSYAEFIKLQCVKQISHNDAHFAFYLIAADSQQEMWERQQEM